MLQNEEVLYDENWGSYYSCYESSCPLLSKEYYFSIRAPLVVLESAEIHPKYD